MEISEQVGSRPHRLVFVSAGDAFDLHPSLRSCPDFDLLVAFYGEDEGAMDRLVRRGADVRRCKGGKFQNLWTLFRQDPDLLTDYEAVLVLDDDLRLTRSQVVRMFQVREEYGLAIVGPTLRRVGRIGWDVNRTRWRSWMRMTNVIEVGAPLFEVEGLIQFLRQFDGSLVGYGIEMWYTKVIGSKSDAKYAVLDEVAVVNPRSRGGQIGREINRLQGAADRKASWKAASERHQIPWITPNSWGPKRRKTIPAVRAGAHELADIAAVSSRQTIAKVSQSRHELVLAFWLRRLIRRAKHRRLTVAELDKLHAVWGIESWSGSTVMLELISDLAHRGKGSVVECGSGVSTICMAIAVADRPHSEVVALEHHPGWARILRRRIRLSGLKNVRLLERPLVEHAGFDWYDIADGDIPEDVGLIVVDGPPASTRGGRRGGLEVLGPLLSGRRPTVVIDDVNRPEERQLVDDWIRSIAGNDATLQILDAGKKQVAVIQVGS